MNCKWKLRKISRIVIWNTILCFRIFTSFSFEPEKGREGWNRSRKGKKWEEWKHVFQKLHVYVRLNGNSFSRHGKPRKNLFLKVDFIMQMCWVPSQRASFTYQYQLWRVRFALYLLIRLSMYVSEEYNLDEWELFYVKYAVGFILFCFYRHSYKKERRGWEPLNEYNWMCTASNLFWDPFITVLAFTALCKAFENGKRWNWNFREGTD